MVEAVEQCWGALVDRCESFCCPLLLCVWRTVLFMHALHEEHSDNNPSPASASLSLLLCFGGTLDAAPVCLEARALHGTYTDAQR